MAQVTLYDTTLRDGAQREGISFTVDDKLKIARKLDELGIPFIEGGWPGSNPKDEEFFGRARRLKLRQARLVAFGSTRHAGSRAEDDANLAALVASGVSHIALVGKAWDLQVRQVLDTTLEENLAMIADSIAFLKGQGLTVFFDAEHFFDGFKANRDYALACLRAAAQADADCLVLCDTNGGALPSQVMAAVKAAKDTFSVPLGIHAHNDGELAVANTLVAVQAGAPQVQGTINGYGERCGNANLCSVIPNLQLKLGISCLAPEQLAQLTEVAHFVAELANLSPDPHLPYVGASAFTHKAGMHVDALRKNEDSYQHIPPQVVGNRRRILVSELSGRSNILEMAQAQGLALDAESDEARRVAQKVKQQESRGFQYETAEASFELLVRRGQPGYQPPFELLDYKVLVEKGARVPSAREGGNVFAEAVVRVRVDGEIIHTVAEGNGPVNALDGALRKALLHRYPELAEVELLDYKARIVEESHGTAAQIRVFIISAAGEHQWRTMGASTNIIESSWLALADSLEYWLLKQARERPNM